MPIYQIDGLTPVVPEESFVHPTAVLIGDVILGKGVYVGPNASLRGDFGRIVVKDGANIQDNCVMHGFPEQDTVVGEDGHIGHSAILHGCIIRRNALVGMNAVVMDGAVIGENSIVGASAFVKAKAEMPANYLIVGSPAKAIRELSEQELAWKKQGTHEYQVLVTRCKQTLHQVEPLREIEPGRKRLVLMNPLMILVKIIKLRWIHILSYDQMVSRKINNQTTRCANSIFYTTLFTNSAPNYT